MIIAIAVIALGMIGGLVRPRRAFYLLGLIVLLLLSGPFLDALLAFLWRIIPLWLIVLAQLFVLIWALLSAFRLLLGTRATDHMIRSLAAHGVLFGIRKSVDALSVPIRAVRRTF